MVFYRKYRPQSLDDLLGQDSIRQTLTSAYREGKLSHAYLFCGPRGTGKTSTARILAKMINCEKASAKGSLPCNECSSCLSITDGSNIDLTEIDAASNRGIDDIRALRDNIKLSPAHSKKKVYIIDEVHMLSTEAFNALLKTLEEPPEHVVFILATTELHKIPVTILSRVQKLEFKLASTNEIKQALQKIVEGESLDVEEGALELIAQRGEGSFRDAEKLLDQLASRSEKITQELVETTLNIGSFEQIAQMLQHLAKFDAPAALEEITKLAEQGVNLKEYTLNLLEYMRYVLLIQNGASGVVQNNLGNRRATIIQDIAGQFIPSAAVANIKALQDAIERMKNTFMPTLCLEVAMVQICTKESVARMPVFTPTVVTSAPEPILKNIETTVIENKDLPKQTGGDSDHQIAGYAEIVALQDKWTYILETIKPLNYSLEALLRSVRVTSCEDCVVMLEVPYSFHQRILEAPKNRDLLESVFSDVLSKAVRVTTFLGQRPIDIDEVSNIEVAADDEIIRLAAEIFSGDAPPVGEPTN